MATYNGITTTGTEETGLAALTAHYGGTSAAMVQTIVREGISRKVKEIYGQMSAANQTKLKPFKK